MKSRQYILFFIVAVICIMIVDLLMCPYIFPRIPIKRFYGLDFVLFLIFFGGTFLIAPAIEQEGKNFVGRFLVLTTVQMLAALSVFAAIVYTKVQNSSEIVLHSLALFVSVLILQSFLLIKFVKGNSK